MTTTFRDTAGQDRAIARPPFWRRRARSLLIVVAAGVVLAMALPWLLRTSGARASVSSSRVTIATVERGPFVRDVTADGRVVAAGSPTLYAPAAGLLTFRVQAGDRVEKQQVLAVIDSPDLAAKLSQETSALQGLELEWHRAELDARRSLAEQRTALARAEVDRQTALRELERGRKAHALGSFSELQVLRAQDAYDKANFTLSQAAELAASQPERNRFDVDNRRALVERQRLVVADLRRQVDALQLRSPVDGQVGQLLVADRASVGRDVPLLSVVDLSALEVEIRVPENLARDLASGMSAELGSKGALGRATISGVSPEVVQGQVVARLRFEGDGAAGPAFRQNQRIAVRILLDRREDVLSVARGNFVDQGRGHAYVVQDDVAVRRPVRLGAQSFTRVEILDGLAAGDRVVVAGVEAFDGADRALITR